MTTELFDASTSDAADLPDPALACGRVKAFVNAQVNSVIAPGDAGGLPGDARALPPLHVQDLAALCHFYERHMSIDGVPVAKES